MQSDVLKVEIRGLVPANSGWAIFVGNQHKVFIIQVERNIPNERPLTHDLINSIFKGFSITIERVVITELRNSTYYARLILQQENELGRKIVEIDARPSDCLALATSLKCKIYVASSLFEQVEDMSMYLDQINEGHGESGESE
jgi:hypothetical protein